jgi:hypothetical protein
MDRNSGGRFRGNSGGAPVLKAARRRLDPRMFGAGQVSYLPQGGSVNRG